MIHLTESEKMAWDLYYGFSVYCMSGDVPGAAKRADAMIEQRRLRYMPRHDDKPREKLAEAYQPLDPIEEGIRRSQRGKE